VGGGQYQRNVGHKKYLKFISKGVRSRASDEGEMYLSRMKERTRIIVNGNDTASHPAEVQKHVNENIVLAPI